MHHPFAAAVLECCCLPFNIVRTCFNLFVQCEKKMRNKRKIEFFSTCILDLLATIIINAAADQKAAHASLEECKSIHSDQAQQILNSIDGVMYHFVDSRSSPTVTFFLQQNNAKLIPDDVEHFIFVQVLKADAVQKIPKVIGKCPVVVHHIPTVGGNQAVRIESWCTSVLCNFFILAG